MSAFALCNSNDGEEHIEWENTKDKAIYIDRLGVNVNYLMQGIGELTLKEAMEVAKQKDANYLRLFVVDINKPAINLYVKSGFKQAEGIYEEMIEDFVLPQYGFEMKL